MRRSNVLTEVYRGGVSHRVATEREMEAALDRAWNEPGQLHLIQATLAENDASETLRKLAQRLGERVGPAAPRRANP